MPCAQNNSYGTTLTTIDSSPLSSRPELQRSDIHDPPLSRHGNTSYRADISLLAETFKVDAPFESLLDDMVFDGADVAGLHARIGRQIAPDRTLAIAV